MNASSRQRNRGLLGAPTNGNPCRTGFVCKCCKTYNGKLYLNISGDFACASCGAVRNDLQCATGLSSNTSPAKPQSLFDTFPQMAPSMFAQFTSSNGNGKRLKSFFSGGQRFPVTKSQRFSTQPKRRKVEENCTTETKESDLGELLKEHDRICEKINSATNAQEIDDDKNFKFVCGFYCNLCDEFIDGGIAGRNRHKKSDNHKAHLNKDSNSCDAETMFEGIEKDYGVIVFDDQDTDDNGRSYCKSENGASSSGTCEKLQLSRSSSVELLDNVKESGENNGDTFAENLHNDDDILQSDVENDDEYVTESEWEDKDDETGEN